jgi:hypothetical protein
MNTDRIVTFQTSFLNTGYKEHELTNRRLINRKSVFGFIQDLSDNSSQINFHDRLIGKRLDADIVGVSIRYFL